MCCQQDYDCFYAAVVENENPALKHQCLAIQQKQIIVTCNYEARRRGLYKLQLISEARRLCPEVVIVLGEDIGRFRDASKELYQYLKSFSWNDKAERLGFDEVFMDITDMVNYNLDILNPNALHKSFFQLCKEDPTQGFAFDATVYAGHVYPEAQADVSTDAADEALALRLQLGSHVAMHLRLKLEEEKGYTSTVGISTSKLLSKLVGNLHKPMGQTTIVPPYRFKDGVESNVTAFIDDYEVGKIPGIGFKLAQKLRQSVLQRPADFDTGLVYGGTKEAVTVRDVRLHQESSPEKLEILLGGPGSPHGIGLRIWQLLHGVDDTEVALARTVPRQISIEDSYIRLDTLPEVIQELTALSHSLIARMHIDLMGDDEDEDPPGLSHDAKEDTARKGVGSNSKWLAHPRTIRLSTRPRPPLNADGTRTRSFKRISHSAPLPKFIFGPISLDTIAEKLVREVLLPMFHKLHPEKAGWNLSLVNVAVTNMAETAGESKTASGRNIGSMFRRQDDVLKDFRVLDNDWSPPLPRVEDRSDPNVEALTDSTGAEGKVYMQGSEDDEDARWESEEDSSDSRCKECGASIPEFALLAHMRYHRLGDQ